MPGDDHDDLAPGPAGLTQTYTSTGTPGTSIGPYRLLERIGEGGMGEVWLAEQQRPVRRQVALKIIKAGLDTVQVVARFEAERQALALMDHPAIAKVFEAGSTELGRPYFAMELVRGESLTTYCDRQRLTIPERLELFIHVCEGVQHAHQKGIIHRDLKPSNILVTMQDDHAVPKIIDFGIAKATSQPLTEHTLYTSLGGFIGTPEYMSPEQAELGGMNIDTRADVYALGVVLYQLIAGTLPFDRQTFSGTPVDEIRRTIREVNPLKPSARITRQGNASREAAENRRTSPAHLAGSLRVDLDWITMKALEKDRTRRYGSASEFAVDIRHHLASEPVLARPPSALYRSRKFAQRHRFGVAAAALIAVLVTGFAVAMMLQTQRIARERDRANSEAQLSKRITEFLMNLFTVSDPGESRGRSVTARELLDAGATQISETMKEQPVLQARLMETIGVTYDRLGLYSQAQEQLQRAVSLRQNALGAEHADTMRTLSLLAALHTRRAQYSDAISLYERVIDVQSRSLGSEHPDRLAALQDLGWLIAQRGDYQAGEKLVREALDTERRVLGNQHANTLRGMNRLAAVVGWQRRFREEEELLREELTIRRKIQGTDHPEVLAAMRSLAGVVGEQGRLADAEPLLREAVQISKRVLGPEHPGTASALHALARVLTARKQVSEAEQLFVTAIDIWRRKVGDRSNNTIVALNNLGLLYLENGRYRDAAKVLSEVLPTSRGYLGPDHQTTLMIMNNLALIYAKQRKFAQAISLATDTVSGGKRGLGLNHRMTALLVVTLAEVLAHSGQTENALRRLEEAADLGYSDSDQIAKDEYFKPLRKHPRFDAVLKRMREVRRN